MSVRERIYLTREELEQREMAILNDRHIERYGMIRQWCHGFVVDFGCGCGYGSHMISRNPDVRMVIGVDKDLDAMNYANEHYKSNTCKFNNSIVPPVFHLSEGATVQPYQCDTFVALEIMEHMADETELPRIAKATNASTVIISYPSKKTTHYNPHHFHDFTREDMHRLWESDGSFRIVEFIELYREHMIVRLERVK